jgi:hypothetical protein
MKQLMFYIVCFFVFFFLNSCDWATETKLEIMNESSYDLHIEFKTKKLYTHQNEYGGIDVKIGESVFLILDDFGGRNPRDPTEEIEFIVFYHLYSTDIIKEIDKDYLTIDKIYHNVASINIFAGDGRAYYQFKITDEFLNKN